LSPALAKRGSVCPLSLLFTRATDYFATLCVLLVLLVTLSLPVQVIDSKELSPE